MDKRNYVNNSALWVILIIVLAIVVRMNFFMGQIFSDDSYYNQLAVSMLQGNYGQDYVGYPIYFVRKMSTLLTAFSFFIIGRNEIASVFPQFLFSLLSIILIYKITLFFTEKKEIALLSAFLMAVFPTDVIFATLNFADLIDVFFINLGILFLLFYKEKKQLIFSFFAGISFGLSLLIKSYFYYIALILVLLLIFNFFNKKEIEKGLTVALCISLSTFFIEGIFYYIIYGNFFYRFDIISQNYSYAYYDFFPGNYLGKEFSSLQYLSALLQQFADNIKHVFLRRFYLLLPLAALIEAFLQFREKKNSLLLIWFIGLTVFLILMTTSLFTYRPLDLRSSWYIYPLIFPTIILSSFLLNRFKKILMYSLLILIFISGMYISHEYQKFFNLKQVNALKEYLNQNPAVEIYTDHHTKYGIDLIDGYPEKLRTNIILGKYYSLSQIPAGSKIIYNFDRISELELQGFYFPDFTELQKKRYFKDEIFGKFQVFSVLNNISFNKNTSKKYPKSLLY